MPKYYYIQEGTNENDILAQADHGDMVVKSVELRSRGIYFVKAKDNEGNTCDKTLVQKDSTGAAYCSVPEEITIHFDDPVNTYMPLLVNKAAKITLNDWFAIELHAGRHQAYLLSCTGGKPVATNRLVTHFVNNNGEDGKGTFIYNPETADEKNKVWIKLKKSISPKYLSSSPYYLTATDFSSIQKKNRKIYEEHFIQWLKLQKEGTALQVEDINGNFNAVAANDNFLFASLHTEGDALIVKTKRVEYVLGEVDPAKSTIESDADFIPTLLYTEGPFANITFFVCQTFNLKLAVPTWSAEFKKMR